MSESENEGLEEAAAEESTGGEGAEPEVAAEASEPLAAGQANLGDDGDADDAELMREGPGLAGTVSLASKDLKGALEALILVSDKPIAAVRLARLTRQDIGVIKQKLAELQNEYEGRGIVLDEIAGGFQFRTSGRFAPFVRMLVQQKPTKLTRAQLEVLAIIAYRQPVTRPEIDDVRGVDSGSAIKVLLERNVIKIIGKKDEAGRPMLYGTTTDFLELFGLKSLRDLPTLREFAELTPESRDIYERRIGEPIPDSGMNLQTHYTPDESRTDEDGEGELAADVAADSDDRVNEQAGGELDPATGDSPEDEDRTSSAAPEAE